ncbi:NAD-dependent epimerase/dehydratase family protein [Rugosibacter aromaticivorans]|uniref:NAD-dependent epimerase/dehydratase family protein n=1 Tax=Rugosibacter aromaticivorans TaxID=1565605 RepID=UPI001F3F1439|nr:NAD-dependent epimerase/dehydratase family protein [Rugosibacter aromaticivorans]
MGCGDVIRRVLPELLQRWHVLALVRTRDPRLTALGVRQIEGNLDQPATLRRLAGIADAVIHSAPPPAEGQTDSRTTHLLSALRRGKSLPRQIVYISTSGVYGNSQGAVVSETRPLATKSARAIRRVDAERRLRAFACRGGRHIGHHNCCVSILRAPGIYAADRLPLERLRQGLPLFVPEQDSHTNHIHAADLGRACLAALHRGRPNRTYNVSDDSVFLMGEWFDLLADSFALPRAPRLPRETVQQRVSPLQWSFMSESRQLDNTRMKRELGLRLCYPTVATGIKETSCSG